MKHLGDITKLNGAEIPAVDCITGGSPCQDLSVAGKRAGLDGERSGLFMEQIRIVKEMRKKEIANGRAAELVRPRWMVWENVPGAFSSNGGKDFRAVLTEIVRIVSPECPDVPMPKDGKWSKAGCLYDELGRWSIAWRVHDAQFWGVPQRRKRIALVADFGGMCAPEVLFERKGLSRDSEPCGEAGQETAGGTGGGTEGAEPILLESNQNHATVQTDGISTAIPASMGMGGGYVPMVTAYGFEPGTAVQTYSNQAIGAYAENDKASSIKQRDYKDATDLVVAAVDCRNMNENHEVVGTIQSKENGGYSLNYQNPVRINAIVRRLTPLECERLQGYPDGWTDIGEWVDTKGKKHKEADSQRYKALGNSIALPFWFYLLRRISATYERPATLGSLFDGIGGFPLCWERCNGKGTAVWASDIEEFPIAVTKIRFPE